jgi:microcystin-dependent protein
MFMKTMFTSSTLLHRFLVMLMLAGPTIAFSQIGVGTTTPHPSAMMHISPGAGNNKGFILPKITSGSRVVLDSTQNLAHGLIFFDTDLQKFYYFHQAPKQWFELDHDWIRKDIPGASPVVGTHIYSGVPGNVGIGTGTAFNPTEKFTVVGNVSIGASQWAQDSSITIKSPSLATGGGLAVDAWLGVNTVTRTGGNELDVKGQANITSTLTVGGAANVTGNVTANKFIGLGIMPIGSVVMWSGTINITTNFDANGAGVVGTQYEGWQMCNGYNGSPDLRGRFVVGRVDHSTQVRQSQSIDGYTNTEYDLAAYDGIGNTGGEREHVLTIGEMPSHAHGGSTSNDGSHNHGYTKPSGCTNGVFASDTGCFMSDTPTSGTTSSDGNHNHTISTQGNDNAHENRPPYYVLAFLIRKQ